MLPHKTFTFKYVLLAIVAVLIIWKFSPLASTPPSKEPSAKVDVTVYYEVLCPDSIRFVRTQLHPAFNKLHKIMTYTLVPYGKATTTAKPDGGYEFECQHGDEECLGNMVHACSIQYVESKDSLLNYVSCMIKNNRSPLVKGLMCAKEYNLDWHSIEKCAKSLEGQTLLFQEGEKTNALSPALSFVPTVELNGSRGDQNALITNLTAEVCKAYTGPAIPECSQYV